MALLDDLPLDILLAIVKQFQREDWYDPVFYQLRHVASVSTRLRWSLLPLLYRDLAFNFKRIRNYSAHHNAVLANLAGCSEYAQRVTLFADKETPPGDIVRAVRDDMEAGNETKWPNLHSYACIYDDQYLEGENWLSCSDCIRQLDKELPKLRQAPPIACDVSSGITPLVYTPPSVSFLTQLTSLCLNYDYRCIDANRLPQFFAPTLVYLTLYGVNPEDVWNAFYDGHENQTVVFAKLRYLDILFKRSLSWEERNELPPHLQGVTNSALAKRSVWAAGAASGKPGCRVPLFPVLRTLKCEDMTYGFRDFISRTQCHNSLVSLYVKNDHVYFDFDAELFKDLETVEFSTPFQVTNEETTGCVDLYKSAFTSLLHAKTNIQRMSFRSDVPDIIFQVPRDIGCTNLRLLILGVYVDFKSVLRLLSNLKHLIQLELNVDDHYRDIFEDWLDDTLEYIDEFLPPQVDYPPVSSTLRWFKCRLHNPTRLCCYTVTYALELALHLPALKDMVLGISHEDDVAIYKAMLGRLIEKMSRSPYMNDGLLNAKAIKHYLISWHRYV
ncbi:hypothetical protein GQ54DRAFT_300161 [Martensiomyces pterosporus]|nr:hypothetical protein GQ54DRAFT_300161 [Martensiomyces pterosporus]